MGKSCFSIISAAFCLLLAAESSKAWNASEVDFPSDGNGFPDPATIALTAKYTGPDGSPEWFRYTLESNTNDADFGFKMTTGNLWANDYGGNTNFLKNTVGVMYYQPAGDANSILIGGVTSGYSYVFTVKNPALSDSYISVMEVSNDPVFISAASGPVGALESNEVLTYTVLLYTNPPPEERVFIRITTNDFASWSVVELPLTNNYATITMTNQMSSLTTTTRWYALVTTATSNYLASLNGYGVDAMTLSWANNQGSNYLFRTNPRDPAFVFHNNNRVILNGTNVQFWTKVGYANADGSGRWATNGCVYYTVDGTEPAGSFGTPGNASTFVAPMQFSHIETDPYELGDAMWWFGTAYGLPGFTTIKYKIGMWHSATERFADFNAGVDNTTFSFQLGTLGEPVLTINGLGANYTTTKMFLDEINGDVQDLVIIYKPGVVNPTKAEVFSNVGRRDYVDVDYNNDGVPDGIRPPDGNTITTNDTGAYFRAFPMLQYAPGEYIWTARVSRCGSYRLTARHQTVSNTNWTYYSSSGRRDHAIVASPTKTHDQTMYELNTLTVEAQGADEGGRSTFTDLLNAGQGDTDGYDPFNLEYLNFLQVNCLWFQPIHPNGIDRSENDPFTGQRYAPGSPYATKNYFWVGAPFGTFNNEANAMDEFTNFVAQCDAHTGSVGTINVMLDGVFNHTSWDAVFGQGGIDLGIHRNIADTNSPVVSGGDRIGTYRHYWYADSGVSYCDEADYYNSAFDNDLAVAPDRGDFGKWSDVTELYFGRYAALVCVNPQDNGNYVNEGDWFDYGSMTPGVIELWKLFGYYPEFWLKKTGHSGTNSFILAQDDKGIDGLRCDFGQGLPPQMWEYIINRTRSKKWNFLFMAETLDGGSPGYRSNRHFDILNENLVFNFTQAKVNNTWEIRGALEGRRNAYNGGAILLNLTSHDEILPDSDPWVVVSRYGAVSSVDGIPMIFYGQEKGIKNYEANPAIGYNDGFVYHELNFGKYVPHFKRWNQLTVWFSPPPDATFLDVIYARINFARHASPALRSVNRFFLNRMAGGDNAQIFAVAKYEQPFSSPRNKDVVLAFANLLRHGQPHTLAADTYDLRPAWGQLGLDTNRQYKVRNLAASDINATLPGWPKTGVDMWNNGVFVSLDGGQFGPVAADGALVQYLKIEEELDYDNDGLHVDFELQYGLNPTDGTGDNGAFGDPDLDGHNNMTEQIAGTNPNDGNSFFEVQNLVQPVGPSQRNVQVPTAPGRRYTMYYADGALSNGMLWTPFANSNNGFGTWFETSTVNSTRTFIDDESTNSTMGPPNNAQRAYRAVVELP